MFESLNRKLERCALEIKAAKAEAIPVPSPGATGQCTYVPGDTLKSNSITGIPNPAPNSDVGGDNTTGSNNACWGSCAGAIMDFALLSFTDNVFLDRISKTIVNDGIAGAYMYDYATSKYWIKIKMYYDPCTFKPVIPFAIKYLLEAEQALHFHNGKEHHVLKNKVGSFELGKIWYPRIDEIPFHKPTESRRTLPALPPEVKTTNYSNCGIGYDTPYQLTSKENHGNR